MHRARLGWNLVLVLAVGTVVLAGTAHADPTKCRAAIAKSSASFAQAKMKALQKCQESIVKGKFTGVCPDGDAKTKDKITKAAQELKDGIAKACGGKDKQCGTSDEGEDTMPSIGWDISCPNFENSADPNCNKAITNCSHIGECLECIGEKAVDQAISLYYGGLNLPSTADKVLNKCQLAIGKSAAAFFTAKSKALQKCWDKVNKDAAKGLPTTPCPPFGPGDGKAQGAIDKASVKTETAICKACGGVDKDCRGADNLPVTKIGFPSCPFVTAPGTAPKACGDPKILVLQGIVDCVDCVTEFKVDCLDLAESRGFPNVPAYPAECNPAPTATPTATATATPTATGTAIATPTTTPTPTVTPTVIVTTVKVHVVDADSRADVIGAALVATPGGATATTDASGRATFVNLPSGIHRFTASAPGLELAGTSIVPGATQAITSEPISILFGAAEPIDLRLRRIDRETLNLVTLHTDGNATYTLANCEACHNDRKHELSADPTNPPWHALATHSSLGCLACHQTVDLTNHSGASIRKQVDVLLCIDCHPSYPASF